MTTAPFDSLLLVGFGGPTEPGHSLEFVRRVVGNRPGAEARVAEVARHYDDLGGVSPYNERTFAQASALGAWLRSSGVDLPVQVGLRFWEPLVGEVAAAMAETGCRRALAIILSTFQCSASWEAYQQAVSAALERLGPRGFAVDYLDPFAQDDGFIEASADNIQSRGRGELGDERFASARLILTAHSIPEPAATGAPYAAQFAECAAAIAKRLGREAPVLAFQSAAAGSRVPWLGPDVSDAIHDAAARGARDVVVSPIGFLCDHVEVLYDLDIVARRTATECGVGFVRAPTVQTHPRFIAALGERVLRKLR